jgi:CPA2 family monovalent cation:H+ antiporter-2
MKVGGTSITTRHRIIVMVLMGFLWGLGWVGNRWTIFLGVILSISTIYFKTFDELGGKSTKFAGIVMVH